MKKARCPKCGSWYTEPPALSRTDNETLICPECGMREALEDAWFPGLQIGEAVAMMREGEKHVRRQTEDLRRQTEDP